MFRMFSSFKQFYANLRIKYKLFALISALMLAVSLVSLAVHQYVFDVYEGELYRQAAKSLQLSSSGIESELKKMERLSFRIATDHELQERLNTVATSESDYDRYNAIDKLIKERLPVLGSLEKYVRSLQLYDYWDEEHAAGTNPIRSSPERIQEIVGKAAEYNGGHRWLEPIDTDTSLVLVREIRAIDNSNFLTHLGTIAIRIDTRALMNDFARGLNSSHASFLITEGENLVYPQESELPVHHDELRIPSQQGFMTAELEGNRYFITYMPSQYLNWTYTVLIPYDVIFNAILRVKNTVWIIYAVLLVIAIIAAVRVSRGITRPIESLNTKMKRVQFGNFDMEDVPQDTELYMDEAGQLHRNFRIMVNRIHELIRENYLKQLTIKDSEFRALQAQINPHFLYNTLESINWLAKMEGHQHISRMVESLGFLLRSSFSLKAPLITLLQEIEIVRNYITIQKIRFEERLDFAIDIPQSLMNTEIPKLSLQPLVENSVNYALEQMIDTCVIRIKAESDAHRLLLTVQDNGPGIDPAIMDKLASGKVQARGSGVGLHNIDERIKLLFGAEYGLEIDSQQAEGTRVTLILPLRTEG